jgi:hypothetical protein
MIKTGTRAARSNPAEMAAFDKLSPPQEAAAAGRPAGRMLAAAFRLGDTDAGKFGKPERRPARGFRRRETKGKSESAFAGKGLRKPSSRGGAEKMNAKKIGAGGEGQGNETAGT